MAWSFVSYATGEAKGDDDLTISGAMPSHQSGDILLFGGIGYMPGGLTDPSGWTRIGSQVNFTSNGWAAVYWKRAASSSEAAPAMSGSGNWGSCGLVVIRGIVASGDPVHAYSNTAYGTSNTTLRAATVTTTVSTALIFFGMSSSDATRPLNATEPSGYTERVDWSADESGGIYISTKDASAETTGNVDATLNRTVGTWKHAALIALTPAAAAGISIPVAMCHYRKLRG